MLIYALKIQHVSGSIKYYVSHCIIWYNTKINLTRQMYSTFQSMFFHVINKITVSVLTGCFQETILLKLFIL